MARTTLAAILIALIVTLTRVPLLQPGFGTDPDAWRVARVASQMAHGGGYEVSRFPGNPLHEIVSAMVWGQSGYCALLLTAVMSGISAALFYLLLVKINPINALFGALAFAMTPIVFIGGTELLDYHFALSAVLASFLTALSGRGSWAGILLGIASGARFTSLAFGAPLILILLKRSRSRAIVEFITTILLFYAICYSPVLYRYGFEFFKHYVGSFPSPEVVLRMATIEVLGELGACAVILGITLSLLGRLVGAKGLASSVSLLPYSTAAILVVVLFLWLPLDSGYLIAAVPFFIIVFRAIAPATVFRTTAALLMLSPLLALQGDYRGEVLKRYAARVEQYEVVTRVMEEIDSLHEPSVIVLGEWSIQLKYRFTLQSERIRLLYTVDEASLQNYLKGGWEVYFLPGVDEYNLAFSNGDLVKIGAKPLGVL